MDVGKQEVIRLIPDCPSEKFYKRRSQEKTLLLRLEVFLLRSPLDRARSVLAYCARCSVEGQCDPVVWVFSTSGFHRFFATKPVSSETSEAERRSNLATIVLIWNDLSTTSNCFFFLLCPFGRQRRSWSRWFSRRLITLIFAGRNRIIVIRRELPRTNDVGSVRRPST